MAASILEDMSRSVTLLQGLPDQQSRVDSITTFKKELEELFSELGLGWAAGIRFALKEFSKKYKN